MDDDRPDDEPLLDVPPTPPRRRRWPWAALAALAVFGAAGTSWWWARSGSAPLGLPTLGALTAEKATLYFADPRWSKLAPEERRLAPSADAVARIGVLLAALAQGPQGEAAPVLPKGLKVRGAYLGKDGLAVVDLDDLGAFDPGGASGEALTVFSVVHTLTANVPGVTAVQFLVGGREQETLAGHVKISEPLTAEPQWLGTAPRP